MKKLFLIVIGFLLFLFGRTELLKESVKKDPDSENTKRVSLVAVGDDLIHETVYQAAKTGIGEYDFKPMLSDIKPFIRNFDLSFINQETILGGVRLGLSTYPCFNSPYSLGDALVDAGFNLISIANNHTMDRGEKAVINSVNYWKNQPVIYSGSEITDGISNVKLFNKNGIKFAFVAYTYGINGNIVRPGKEHLVNLYSREKARNDLSRIRSLVDVILVSMHWGTEYRESPDEFQKEESVYLSELGADIIIGHHPHVIQPVEMIENSRGEKCFVIYSLGNFLSDQNGIDRLVGMAVSLEIEKSQSSPISLKNPKATLLYRYKDLSTKQFSMKLFSEINEMIIRDYKEYYEKKKALIRTYYQEIIVE